MNHLDTDRRSLYTAPDDSRDRLIRVEENLKHINSTLQQIQSSLEHQNTVHAKDLKETATRVEALEKQVIQYATKEEVAVERKRTDRIYVLGSIVTFLGLPTTVYLMSALITKFGH